jgi:mannose-6-phosphate isomerase-like protein (cupin superfamily)
MKAKPKVVHKITDVPLLESPDGANRDSFLVTEDTCGSRQYTAGLYFVRPGERNRADRHPGQEEVYYIFQGAGTVTVDSEVHRITAGDVVFIPDGSTHFLSNDTSETLGLFWAIAAKWSNLQEIQRFIGTWHEVKIGSPWQS